MFQVHRDRAQLSGHACVRFTQLGSASSIYLSEEDLAAIRSAFDVGGRRYDMDKPALFTQAEIAQVIQGLKSLASQVLRDPDPALSALVAENGLRFVNMVNEVAEWLEGVDEVRLEGA
jgi:hypothetical protein